MQLCWMFQFSKMNVCIWTSIFWYFNKIDQITFSEMEKKFFPTISLFFRKMTAEVPTNDCTKRHEGWQFPWYILDIAKLAGSKLIKFCVCLSSLQSRLQYPTRLQSVSWSLAEFRHNKIVQSPHENYFNICRQHKEKWDLVKMTIIQTGW